MRRRARVPAQVFLAPLPQPFPALASHHSYGVLSYSWHFSQAWQVGHFAHILQRRDVWVREVNNTLYHCKGPSVSMNSGLPLQHCPLHSRVRSTNQSHRAAGLGQLCGEEPWVPGKGWRWCVGDLGQVSGGHRAKPAFQGCGQDRQHCKWARATGSVEGAGWSRVSTLDGGPGNWRWVGPFLPEGLLKDF